MYKRSRKTKGVSRRLAALLLCCACLFGAVSVSAIALEAEASPVTEVPARAAILEDSGTVSDNTEPAPATEAPAPTETKPPVETTAPTEASTPTESTAPAETTAPTEAPAPAGTNDPTEPETTAPAETTAPTDPEEGIAPVSETEPEPTGTADPEKDSTENGEIPENGETLEDEESGEPVEDAPETLSVYDRLMAAATCEEALNILESEELENPDALFALTVDELTAVRTHAEGLEEDGYKEPLLSALDALIAKASGGETGGAVAPQSTFTITNTIANAEVAYVDYQGSDSDIVFKTVVSGQPVTTSGTSGVLIFFLKPAEGYLLTQYKDAEDTARDLYGISIPAENTNVGWFTRSAANAAKANEILVKAKALDYVGYYAFTYDTGSGGSAKFTVEGQKPQMTITATATPDSGLKPGDEVTFTITITPGDLPGVDEEVTRKEITSLKINGTDYTATPNTDGTYSVKYTITEEDWANQEAHLDVDAELDYRYAVGVTDRNKVDSEILTTTTIRSSASCDVQFETKKGVLYTLKFDPTGITPPDKIPAAPVDDDSYFTGKNVTVKDYDRTTIDDPANQGTWTFTGWECGDRQNLQAEDKVQMTGDSLLFTGTWTFTPYPTRVLTIQKTVSGNMQDANKAFAFTVTSADKNMTYNGESGKEFTFDLKKDQSVTVTVPVGAKVTVTENRNGYVQSIGSGTTIPEANRETVTDGITFTMPDADSILIFNNDKNITVDTGILLDSLPYVLILVLVGVGAVLFLKKRHGRDDD